MTVSTLETEPQNMLVIHVEGRLTLDDYRNFLPEIERRIRESGRIRLLFMMDRFGGWDEAALTKDLDLGARHFSGVERLAVVGDKRWERWMEEFSPSFPAARIGYFDPSQEEEARRWLASD